MSKKSPDQKDHQKSTLPEFIAVTAPGSNITNQDVFESICLVMAIIRYSQNKATSSTKMIEKEGKQQEKTKDPKTDGIPVEGTPYCIKEVNTEFPNGDETDGEIDPTLIHLRAVIGRNENK